MPVATYEISVSARGFGDVLEITKPVREAIRIGTIRDGIGCLFVPGATGAVTTLEFEPGCVADLKALFERIAPVRGDYEHARTEKDTNGHSHVRAALLGPSLSFPVLRGEPMLGNWQQIVFVDFDDRPRARHLILQLVGE